MTQKEIISSNEKLPDIYTYKQNIKQRNEIIDEYIKSLDQKDCKQNNNDKSLISDDEDDKDPFSIKNLKKIKKENKKNKLILPKFKKREILKSESASRNHNGNNIIPKNSADKKMPKKKNYSNNNIIHNNNDNKNNHKDYLRNIGKVYNINEINNDINSKWGNSSSSYNNYINFSKSNSKNNNKQNINCNIFKFNNNINKNDKNEYHNNNSKGRSKSHIGNKDSYNLYKNKIYINPLLNNSNLNTNNININLNKKININKKYATTQIGLNPYSYHNSGKNNLYNNIYKMEKKKRRNYTAKMIKTNISIKDNKKYNYKIRINSTLNTHRIIQNRHQIYEKLVKEKNNPYGLNWINKILKKNKLEKVMLSKEFINGVPIIKLLGKGDLSKREIKKRLSEIEKKKKEEENKYNNFINEKAQLNENKLDDEYNIPNEILEQFNKNSKNFFKIRKDIIEVPDEDEQEHENDK